MTWRGNFIIAENSFDPVEVIFNGSSRRYTLSNGLKVGIFRYPALTITARLTFNYGSVYELPNESGLGHLIEHIMMVDGSEVHTAQQADQIRSSFGYNIPEIDVDRVSIPIGATPLKLETVLQYLSSLPFRPRFDPERVNSQRARVLREIADDKSKPEYRDIREYFDALLGSHPSNYNILGKEEIVKNARIEDLAQLHQRGYTPNNAWLILTGPLPLDTEILVEKYFGKIHPGNSTNFSFPPINPISQPTVLNREAQELYDHDYPYETTADIRLGLVVPPFSSEDGAAITIIAHALITYTNSRLFSVISDEEGLAYSLDGGYSGALNKGVIELAGTVKAVKIDRTIDSIFREFGRMRNEPMNTDELDALTNDLYYATLRKLEHSSGCAQLAEGVFETGVTPDQWHKSLSQVTSSNILEAARKYLPKNQAEGGYVLLTRNPNISS